MYQSNGNKLHVSQCSFKRTGVLTASDHQGVVEVNTLAPNFARVLMPPSLRVTVKIMKRMQRNAGGARSMSTRCAEQTSAQSVFTHYIRMFACMYKCMCTYATSSHTVGTTFANVLVHMCVYIRKM
jgi:hypothetical protein